MYKQFTVLKYHDRHTTILIYSRGSTEQVVVILSSLSLRIVIIIFKTFQDLKLLIQQCYDNN